MMLCEIFVKDRLKIAVNCVKQAGFGAAVENFNTCREYLSLENRDIVWDALYIDHAHIKYLSRFDLELAKLAQKKLELAFCAYFASSVAFMRRNTHFFQQNHFFF